MRRVGQRAGIQAGLNGLGEGGFAGAFVGQRQQGHGIAASRVFALGVEQGLKGAAVGLARKQPVAVGEVAQRHGFASQRVDDVPVVNDMAGAAVRLGSPTRQLHQRCCAEEQLQAVVVEAHGQLVVDQAGGDGVEHPPEHEAAGRGDVCPDRVEVARTTQQQRTLDGALEMPVRAFDGAVLVRFALVVAGGRHAVVSAQRRVTRRGVFPLVPVEVAIGRRQAVAAVFPRCAAERPQDVATTASARTIAADAGRANGPLDGDTVRGYLKALRRLMVYEEQPAWSSHLRPRSSLRNSPKRHFADPSLAAAGLGATPEGLLADLELFGLLFESLAHHELTVYAQAGDAAVRHYRDNTSLEVNAMVEDRQGRWWSFEDELGAAQIDAAAKTLLKSQERVDAEKTGAPGILGVIVGSGYGYLRDDGVAVVPIAALGP